LSFSVFCCLAWVPFDFAPHFALNDRASQGKQDKLLAMTVAVSDVFYRAFSNTSGNHFPACYFA
jgi:hypothetical protein